MMKRFEMVSICAGRGGLAFFGVLPSLLLWAAPFGTPPAAAPDVSARPYPDEFPLFPTLGSEGASGMVYLRQPWSPFGVSVDEEGRVEYELTVQVADLPATADESYRVWLTTPTFESIMELGTIEPSGRLTGKTDWHQLMVVVSRESAGRLVKDGERWDGPIVLRGHSAGARVMPLSGHSLFQRTPM
jgi:hypothetical protein